MNSIYYPRNGKDVKISDKVLEEQGTLMAEEIVQRLRAMEGLENIPIVLVYLNKKAITQLYQGIILRQLLRKLERSIWLEKQ